MLMLIENSTWLPNAIIKDECLSLKTVAQKLLGGLQFNLS